MISPVRGSARGPINIHFFKSYRASSFLLSPDAAFHISFAAMPARNEIRMGPEVPGNVVVQVLGNLFGEGENGAYRNWGKGRN